jgi:UDP-GlcNAc:undecaprenyl-phosphate GlcNAc-1-phosphate transferase
MNSWTVAFVLVGSALLSGVVVAGSIRLAHRRGIYDHPDGDRKTQALPIPRLGGVGVALALTISSIASLGLLGRGTEIPLALGVLLPALGAAVVGFIDDRQNLHPYVRLLAQASLAGVAWVLGTRVELSGLAAIDAVVVIVWIMVVVNGVNLLDNSDGLAGSTVMVSAAGATVIAVLLGQNLVSLLGAALVGVCLGYLWHNWHPARVYMGDSGAYFLGFLLAVLIVRLRPDTLSPPLAVLVAVLLVLLPIVDTCYVVTKRLRAGVHPFTAGRDHLSHVLQGQGATVPQSVGMLMVVLLLGVGGAIAIVALA